MNVNQSQHVFGRRGGRARGRGARQLRVVTVQGSVMGPPSRPAPKRKETSSNQTPTTSSRINWRSQPSPHSALNSTNARTTPSSRTRSSTEPESRIILALTEGRGEATCEVGIAAIDVARPSLILCQISDSQSYINTLSKINILNPSEILIPLTFVEAFSTNRLLEKVKEHFHDVKITGVTRTTFNKSSGLQYLRQLCVPSMNSVLLVLQHRYYALTAAGALLTYLESSLYVFYVNESIKVEYQESEGSTIIDVATAGSLELVASARPTLEKRYSCLWDVLNHCKTKIGARTLRASILQPPCSVPEIEARLDCVTELKEHLDAAMGIQALLVKLSNIDQLLSLAIVLPDQAQNCSGRQLNYLLLLNTVLEQLTPLRQTLDGFQQAFFVELRAMLENPGFATIKDLIRVLIHTDAHSAKGQYGTYQRCFAIKSGVNGLLDLMRKSYSERLDDMRAYVKDLGEKYVLALTLNQNDKKGYHILLSLNGRQKKTFKKTDLPAEFIQVERLSGSCTMKTLTLITLSNRVEDIMMEILKMSNIMIYKLLIDVREHMGIFYKLCEDVAKLDMLLSLAKASSAIHYVRPKFADYIEVIHSRHPMLDFLSASEPISNSIYASNDYNMNIITGPNGSGKSIFIRQVLLIQVMAQVGCYVPAQSATLRVSDRILARISLGDDLESGASAFVLEMKEIQYFFNVLTKNTLIIIDELCRSTALEEGTALAMAICEELMKTPAFVFFTTHFKLLAKLADMHLNVKTWQLETLTEMKNDQIILRFTYRVVPGVTSLEHYGIFLAKGSWPESMIEYAEDVLEKLASAGQRQPPHVKQASAVSRLKYDLEADFRMLKVKKQLTRAVINDKLKQYQTNLQALNYNVELALALDQASTTDNQLDGLPMNDCNLQDEMSGNGHGRTDLDGATLGGPLNESGNPDYYNFQNLSFTDNGSTSGDFSELNFNPSGPNQNPVGFFNFDAIEVHQTYHDESRAISNRTIGLAMTQSFYSNVSEFWHPPNPNHDGFDVQQFPGVLSETMDDLQNLSYPNVLDPEVILETSSDVSFYSTRPTPFMGEYDAIHQQDLPTNIEKDLKWFQSNQSLYEAPLEPREAPRVGFGDNSLLSIFGTQPSQQYDNPTAPNLYEAVDLFTEVNQTVPAADNECNDSTSTLTEQQFSIPLQQDGLRTSTPIPSDPQEYAQPFPGMIQFGGDPTMTKTIERRSTSSESIKWGSGQQQRPLQDVFVTPTTLKTPQKSGGTVSISNDSKSQQAKTNERRSTSSESIKWGLGHQQHLPQDAFVTPTIFKTPQKFANLTACQFKSKQGTPSTTKILEVTIGNSFYCSDADISDAINDLQSCGEDFSQEWDGGLDANLDIRPKGASCGGFAMSKGEVNGGEVENGSIKTNSMSVILTKKDDSRSGYDEIAEAIDDLQSCSDAFSQAWDYHDGEDKLLEQNKEPIKTNDEVPSPKARKAVVVLQNILLEGTKQTIEDKSTTPTKMLMEGDIGTQCVQSETQSSLESLGDIHLELFTDSSIADETQEINYADLPAPPPKLSVITQIEANKLNSNRAEPSPTRPSPHHIEIINDLKESKAKPVTPPPILSPTPPNNLILRKTEPPRESSQKDIFCSAESVPKSPQDKPSPKKRKRLGYVTKTSKKSTPIPPCPRDQPSIADDNIFEQSTQETPCTIRNLVDGGRKPDQDAIRVLSPTSSDFDSTRKAGVKKRKWTPPFKINDAPKNKVLKKRRSMFKAPKKLTKKEIEEAFYEQDKRMLESENPGQCLERILNRPSVKQLQQAKHVLSIRRTDGGVVVTPIEEKKPKVRKRFVIPLKGKSETFTPLLCDKNSDMYEEFINSGRKTPMVRQDVGVVQSKVVTRSNNEASQGLSQPSTSGLQGNGSPKTQDALLKRGHYTQNKDLIENIIDKYLNPPSTATSLNIFPQEVNSSFFSQLSASLEDD